jgi:hypothetical protein
MEKSWNQRYKESGSTLSYKEWRKREDEKMASFDGIPSPSLSDSSSFKATVSEMQRKGGLKEEISGKTVFGINKYVLIVAGIVIVSAIAYNVYKKSKK